MLAGRYGQWLAGNPDIDLHDLCWSAATRRQHHPYRLAVSAQSTAGLAEDLNAYAAGTAAHLVPGRVAGTTQAPVFVFTGMGPQWWGMGRELLAEEPLFRQIADECDRIFTRLAGWSILAEMQRPEAESRMAETAIAQSANFIVQVGLAALLRRAGVEPAAIVGHSVGEVAAACVSGALSLEDAVRVSYHRGRLQQRMAGQGRMLAAELTESEAADLIARHGPGKVSLGAINSPASLTLSGDGPTLEAIAAELGSRGMFCRFLRVELAYHSRSEEHTSELHHNPASRMPSSA
jgi:acyl transferase domain-containing protein